jgi:hypothetical protein
MGEKGGRQQMKRLPRKRYAQLVAQWNKGVDAWYEIYVMIEKHGGEAALAEWRDWPENSSPHGIHGEKADLDALIAKLTELSEVDI